MLCKSWLEESSLIICDLATSTEANDALFNNSFFSIILLFSIAFSVFSCITSAVFFPSWRIFSPISFAFSSDFESIASISSSGTIKFLKEGMDIDIATYEGEIIGITLPEKIEYEIVETTDAVKGNTTTNATKDAIIETGLLVKVPLQLSVALYPFSL